MTTETALGITTSNQINPGYPISGGDAVGGNLVIRSTSSPVKGAVILDELTPSLGPNSGALQTLGGIGAQHNMSVGGAFVNMPYGYSVTSIMVPTGLNGFYPGSSQNLVTASVSTSNGIATFTFAVAQTFAPFYPGQSITLSGIAPAGYNGTYAVTACTTTTVSFANTTTGAQSTAGFISAATNSAIVPTITIGAPNLVGGIQASASPVMNYVTLLNTSTTAGSGTAVSMAFAAQPLPPFVVGQLITVAGVVPTGYNGQWVVTACTTTSVTFAATTTGTITTTGYIASAAVVGVTITNPGTGYTAPPAITFSDPNPGTSTYWGAGATVSGVQAQLITVTGASGTGSVASVTYSAQTVAPFVAGQVIVITGIVSAAGNYNGTFTVISASTTTVTYSSAATGAYTSGGVITSTGSPPVYIKAPQTTTSTAYVVGGQIQSYQVMYGGVLGSSVPTHTNGTVANNTAYLTYIGTVAQGYSAIGYSGVITQGAIHQLGAVSQLVVVSVGSGYTAIPTITLSRPDMVGGRQAQAVVTALSSGTIIPGNIAIIDQGSGYLTPPTVTFSTPNTGITPAVAVAVISSPGEKPIVSQLPTAASATSYFLDFGLTGNNVVMLTTGASSSVYFDNAVNSGAAPYVHGFPQGRKVILYVKNTSGSTITITFPNLLAINSSANTITPTISATRTARFEFQVLTTSNVQNTGASAPGGTANDVYATYITS